MSTATIHANGNRYEVVREYDRLDYPNAPVLYRINGHYCFCEEFMDRLKSARAADAVARTDGRVTG